MQSLLYTASARSRPRTGGALQWAKGWGRDLHCTWMVNTMPTKPAVSSATPMDLGPTSFSCSRVLRQWIFPAAQAKHP